MSEPRDDRGRTVYIAVVAAVLASVATTYGLRALEGSIGGSTVKAPDLVGLEIDPAREMAANRGLELVVAAERNGPVATAGKIIGQDAFPESDVPSGTTIHVVTNLGPTQVEVPALEGLTVNEARTELERVGLTLGAQTEGGDGPDGTVSASDPERGESLDVGSSVAIVVVPDGIVVPDVLGRSQRQAREALTALGLNIVVRRRWNEGRPDLSVLELDPAPGTRVEPGSAVTVTIND